MTILLRFLRNYLKEPAYQDATVRVFIPTLLGNAIFTVCYLMQHIANLLHDVDPGDIEDGGLKRLGFWCDLGWPGVGGFVVQAVGLAVVASGPLQLIRCGKGFQPFTIAGKQLVCAALLGLLAAFAVLLFYALVGGRAQYRGLYCAPHFWGTPLNILPLVSGVVILLLVVAALYCRANTELQNLGELAHVCSLREEAAFLRWHGLLALANFFLWVAPLAIVSAVEALGAVRSVPLPAAMLAGWAIKWNALGYFMVIKARTRHVQLRMAARVPSVTTTFHKGKEIDLDTSQLLNRGVSIHFLHAFMHHYSIGMHMHIKAVKDRIVMPATNAAKCPYVDTVLDLRDEALRPAVGTANFFVSHCWADSFIVLMDQLSNFYWHLGVQDTVYFWVDIFAINQHNASAATELPQMHTVIGGVDALVLTLNPWHAPVTLTRVWCLWELLKAAQSDVRVCPVMPLEEEEDFVLTVRQEPGKIAEVLETIDVQKATATVAADKEAIFKEIEDTVGFQGLNASVRHGLKVALQGIAVERSIRGAQSSAWRTWSSQGVRCLPMGPQLSGRLPSGDLPSIQAAREMPIPTMKIAEPGRLVVTI